MLERQIGGVMQEKASQQVPTFWPMIKKWAQMIDQQLNYLDLLFFFLGAFLLLIVLWSILRKKKKTHIKTLSELSQNYEIEIESLKKAHLKEIERAEAVIQGFKERLANVQEEYRENLQEVEHSHSKRRQSLEKGHKAILLEDEHTMYELKAEVKRLREKQLKEVEGFQKEIEKLKLEIEASHHSHAKEIEGAELEIAGLRQQMQAIIDRV